MILSTRSVVSTLRIILRSNFGIIGISSVVSRGLTFITMVYTARVLGQEAFGLLNFGTAVAASTAIIVGPGFLVWGVRAVSQDRPKAGTYLIVINLIQLFLALVAYLILTTIASKALEHSERNMAMAAGLVVFSIAASVDWVCQGLEQFRILAICQMASSTATLAATVLLVTKPENVFSVPIILVGAQVTSAGGAYAWLLHKRLVSVDVKAWSLLTTIIREAIPLGLSGAMITILHYANFLILFYFRGRSELGSFSATYRLCEIMTPIPMLIASVALPRLAHIAAKNSVEIRGLLSALIQITIAIAFIPAVVFVIESHDVIELVYGTKFAASEPLLKFLGPAVVANFAAIIYLQGIIALGEDRTYILSILCAMIVSIFGGILFVPRYGVLGAIIVVASLDWVTWLVVLPAYYRVFGTMFLKEWARSLAGGVALAIFLLIFRWFGLAFWIRLPTAVLIYCLFFVPWEIARDMLMLKTSMQRSPI